MESWASSKEKNPVKHILHVKIISSIALKDLLKVSHKQDKMKGKLTVLKTAGAPGPAQIVTSSVHENMSDTI